MRPGEADSDQHQTSLEGLSGFSNHNDLLISAVSNLHTRLFPEVINASRPHNPAPMVKKYFP
jgi:hypothetical protein